MQEAEMLPVLNEDTDRKLHTDEREQAFISTRIANEIETREQKQGHTRIIIQESLKVVDKINETGLINHEKISDQFLAS